MGYFNLKSDPTHGAFARFIVQHLGAQIANRICGHSGSSASFIGPGKSLLLLYLYDQALGCCVDMAWLSWLQRCYIQCRGGCRYWGDLWHGCRCRNWNSRTWFWDHRCNWLWCSLSGCGRLWHRFGEPGVSLFWCGWWGLGLSIIATDIPFPEVASGMVIDASIWSVYLVAVLWEDMNYCSGYPDFPQGVKCGNWLTSIVWCKLLGVLVSIGLYMLSLVLKVLLNQPVGLLGQHCGF